MSHQSASGPSHHSWHVTSGSLCKCRCADAGKDVVRDAQLFSRVYASSLAA